MNCRAAAARADRQVALEAIPRDRVRLFGVVSSRTADRMLGAILNVVGSICG